MEAQQFIDEASKQQERIIELTGFFYPDLFIHRQADENITKCLEKLK